MHRVSQIVGSRILSSCSAVVVLGVCASTASANLIVDPGFETPSANPTDVLLPTNQAGAAANPTLPWDDLLATTGGQSQLSSDIPPFAAGPTPPPANRTNAGPGKSRGSSGGGRHTA